MSKINATNLMVELVKFCNAVTEHERIIELDDPEYLFVSPEERNEYTEMLIASMRMSTGSEQLIDAVKMLQEVGVVVYSQDIVGEYL